MWSQHFFLQDTANAIRDILYCVLGNCVLSNRCEERFGCRWSWPPCSPDMNHSGFFPEISCTTPTLTMFRICKPKFKLMLKRSQVICCMIQLTTVWFVYSDSARSNNHTLNKCLKEDHIHIDSQWNWAFINVSYTYVPLKAINIQYIVNCCVFFWTLYFNFNKI